MTVADLIAELEQVLEDLGNLEVLIAAQPSWPLAHNLAAVHPDPEGDPVLWLAASEGHPAGRSPYAPREAWTG